MPVRSVDDAGMCRTACSRPEAGGFGLITRSDVDLGTPDSDPRTAMTTNLISLQAASEQCLPMFFLIKKVFLQRTRHVQSGCMHHACFAGRITTHSRCCAGFVADLITNSSLPLQKAQRHTSREHKHTYAYV